MRRAAKAISAVSSFGGAAQHFFAYGRASGKKDVIKFLRQERLVFLPAARYRLDIMGRKCFLYYLLNQRAGMGGIGAGF